MYAAAHDRADVAAALIAAGADVNARTPVSDLPERKPAVRYFVEIPLGGLTPTMFAARSGAVAALRVLADAEADLDAKTPEGFSALVVALDNLHFDAAKVLVEAGASAAGGGLFALVEARNRINYVGEIQVPTGAEHSLEVLELMLANGADLMDRLPEQLLDRDVRFLPPPPKLTDLPLIRAARSSDVDAMRVLIEAGADPALRDDKRGGINPLLAVMTGPELPALIEAERRPTEEEAIPAIDFLLDQGADPSVGNDLGTTALHTAALRNYPGVIRHMAARGVDLNVTDREGFTPLDYAMGRLPARLARGASPAAELSEAAAALRELGARGKEDERTAAR
jgi:ankyrin repeat protein